MSLLSVSVLCKRALLSKQWSGPAPLRQSVGWPQSTVMDLHEEIQRESSDLGVSEERSLLAHSLGYLLDIKVHIPHFSRVGNDMCLKEVPQL